MTNDKKAENGEKETMVDIKTSSALSNLSGPEKAAILFLCLGEQRGSELMQKLDERDIHSITRAMSGLGIIAAPVVEEVLNEFSETVMEGGGVIGSYAAAESMLRGFLPEGKVAGIMKDLRSPKGEESVWDKFSERKEAEIAGYLAGEHEQTAAVILNNIDPEVAAKVLPLLGEEKMQDVAERMLAMDTIPPHMLRQIEETLSQDMSLSAAQGSGGDLQQKLTDFFNKLDPEVFEKLTPAMEERVPDAFKRIKDKMFTFDDLIRLDAQSLARVMRGMQGNTLPLALRGASKEVRDHFLGALPARSREMLLDEMSSMGPVRGKEVRTAQAALVDYTKELARDEVIQLPGADDDELIE